MKIYHICLEISGALKNLSSLKGVMTDEDGRTLPLEEIKMYLLSEQAKGHQVLPCAECDNFDYHHGCRGHDEGKGENE